MDDYVSKPVKLEELGAVLEWWVSREDQEDAKKGAGTPTSGPGEGSKMPEESVDLSALLGLRDLQGEDEPDILNELITLFLDEVPTQLKRLREATQRDDAQSVERIAHVLKGSCGNMGAMGMERICNELEVIGRSGNLENALVQISRLEEEFGRVRMVLEEELPKN